MIVRSLQEGLGGLPLPDQREMGPQDGLVLRQGGHVGQPRGEYLLRIRVTVGRGLGREFRFVMIIWARIKRDLRIRDRFRI